MSLKPIKFKVIDTDKVELRAFDAKVLCQIAKHKISEKQDELVDLDEKIAKVDQMLLDRECTSKLEVVSAEKEQVNKQAGPPAEDPRKESVSVEKKQTVSEAEAPRAPSSQRRPSSTSSRKSTGKRHSSYKIEVCSETGFKMIQDHEIHKVFSESGKVVGIDRSDDNKRVTIEFDSTASAESAVKHAPRSVGDVNDLKVELI